jgi:O-antigen ligase
MSAIASSGRQLSRATQLLWALGLGVGLASLSFVALTDFSAFLVLVSLPIIPFAIYGVVRAMTGHGSYGPLLSVIVIVVLVGNFRYRAYGDEDIDLQVGLKLSGIVAIFVLVLPFINKILNRLNIEGLYIWCLFFCYTVFTCTYAVRPATASISAISLLGGFVFICYLFVCYGDDKAIRIVVAANTMLWVGSLIVYFAVPSLGRMYDWIGGDFVPTYRLQGLLSASNNAGVTAASGLLLLWLFYARQEDRSNLLTAVAGVSGMACLVLSNNRMAYVSLAVSAAVLYMSSGKIAKKLFFLTTVLLFLIPLVTLFAEPLASLISRSGSAEEIASATGRTRIWPVVIELWSETPILGRGFRSALHILPIHPALFLAAAHAHNVYLDILFSGGIIGLGLFIMGLIIVIGLAWNREAKREIAIIVFFMVYGMTEPLVGGPLSAPLIVLFVAIVRVLHQSPSRTRFAVTKENVSTFPSG